MERISHLKQQQQYQQQNNVVGSRFMRDNNSNNKNIIKERWGECRNHDQMSGMFSWPPRSYTCSFCKREFRSAQALGGHMNVHRRDRARLRQLSPPPPPPPPPPPTSKDPNFIINLNINPNPNLDSPRSNSPATSEIKKWTNSDNFAKPMIPICRANHQDLEKDEIFMKLDLKIGLVRESEDDDHDDHEDLDLELRLGYTHY